MSAKELLQKAEALISEAMGTDTPPPAPTVPGTDPQPQAPAAAAAAPAATQPSLEETNLEAARIAKASEVKQ